MFSRQSDSAGRRVRRHCLIEGRVQMVGFRAFAVRAADQLQLQGWVRNRSDGAVEVLVEGAADRVERFLDLLRRGPAAARVDDFQVTELESGEKLGPFSAVP